MSTPAVTSSTPIVTDNKTETTETKKTSRSFCEIIAAPFKAIGSGISSLVGRVSRGICSACSSIKNAVKDILTPFTIFPGLDKADFRFVDGKKIQTEDI